MVVKFKTECRFSAKLNKEEIKTKKIIEISLNYGNEYLDMSWLPKSELVYIEYEDGSYTTITPKKLQNLNIPQELKESKEEVLFELKSRNVKI
jgi:hypothetical protein